MLAGLSPCGILRIPPDFCSPDADAVETAASASAAETATRHHAITLPNDPTWLTPFPFLARDPRALTVCGSTDVAARDGGIRLHPPQPCCAMDGDAWTLSAAGLRQIPLVAYQDSPPHAGIRLIAPARRRAPNWPCLPETFAEPVPC